MKKTNAIQSALFSDLPDVLTVQQARHTLGVGRPAIYRLLAENRLRYFKIGNAYKIPKASLVEFVQRSCMCEESGEQS